MTHIKLLLYSKYVLHHLLCKQRHIREKYSSFDRDAEMMQNLLTVPHGNGCKLIKESFIPFIILCKGDYQEKV